MKILITGSCGYLGRNIVNHLSLSGHTIISWDIADELQKHENINHEIIDLLSDVPLPVHTNVDILYHFAGFANLEEAYERSLDCIDLNIRATARIAEYCVQNDVGRLVFSSSMYACGFHGGFYGASKKSSEIFLETYSLLYGLNTTVFRLGSLYGGDSSMDNGLHRLVYKSIVLREKISINALKTREYIHINDAVHVLCNYMEKNTSSIFEKINVVGQQKIGSVELVKIIEEISGIPIEMEIVDEGNEHYTNTPYSVGTIDKRVYLETSVEFGFGLLQIVERLLRNDL